MAQWFSIFKKKEEKKEAIENIIYFDRSALQTEIDNLSYKIFPIKNDISFKIITEVIKLAKNISALEIAQAKDEKELSYLRGRYKSIADLDMYLESVTTKEFHEKEKQGEVRGKIDLVKKERRPSGHNLAGIA